MFLVVSFLGGAKSEACAWRVWVGCVTQGVFRRRWGERSSLRVDSFATQGVRSRHQPSCAEASRPRACPALADLRLRLPGAFGIRRASSARSEACAWKRLDSCGTEKLFVPHPGAPRTRRQSQRGHVAARRFPALQGPRGSANTFASKTMRLPKIQGLIRRRILVNFRVDPAVMGRVLPPTFQPKLHRGYAIAGICLIRLEQIRPGWLPHYVGMASENAAHRIAVVWEDASGATKEGVFIPRRDTGSRINALAGGRVFPGAHHLADFEVFEDGSLVSLKIGSRDGAMRVELSGRESDELPATSCFRSVEEASSFFEGGSVGYSVTRDCCRLDGIRLEIDSWKVRPLAVEQVVSSYFDDPEIFPPGSASFDHALIMRDILHEWHAEEDILVPQSANQAPEPTRPRGRLALSTFAGAAWLS